MKRLWFAAMLLGLSLGTLQASPNFQLPTSQVEASSEIPQEHLCELIYNSASHFNISVTEAWDAYDNGELTIHVVAKNTYQVQYSGGLMEETIDDIL